MPVGLVSNLTAWRKETRGTIAGVRPAMQTQLLDYRAWDLSLQFGMSLIVFCFCNFFKAGSYWQINHTDLSGTLPACTSLQSIRTTVWDPHVTTPWQHPQWPHTFPTLPHPKITGLLCHLILQLYEVITERIAFGFELLYSTRYLVWWECFLTLYF